MKRFIFSLSALLLTAALFSGCAPRETSSSSRVSSSPIVSASSTPSPSSSISVSSSSSAPAQAPDAVPAPTQEELEALVADNFDCMANIFSLGSLPVENYPENPVEKEDYICKVNSDRFPDYAAFESYIRSVYCREFADLLLYDYPYEGDPKYLERDGALYLNTMYDGGKGYYVDFQNYTVTPGGQDGASYDFSIETTIEEPAATPQPQPYTIKGRALYEEGRWVLEKMLY